MNDAAKGLIVKVSGPVVVGRNIPNARLNDIVMVGNDKVPGEIIRIDGSDCSIQVFEDTGGVSLGEPVSNTHAPLSVTLGPGLLGMMYDGIQRPLEMLRAMSGDFIQRGLSVHPLDSEKRWEFTAKLEAGDKIRPGAVLGEVEEKQGRTHRILAPPDCEGVIGTINSGLFAIDEVIGTLNSGRELKLAHRWPVKRARPFSTKLDPKKPFITGQRVLDSLFPICLGGSAILPGGFGCGKTVVEHMLARYSNADIIVYVGCGERGNEMTDVLTEFPRLEDPNNGRPLMERTVLIANTSNMPVAAREASIYCGVTIAEYYRDMGYDVAVLVDSSSRWAEAMREISSRLEEMPGEEGYPTYLATRLAGLYERSGRVTCAGDPERKGSVTIIGAVSPAGGDFSEPVTQNSQRVAGALWALDPTLAYRRHFPSLNWNRSYSLYTVQLENWFRESISPEWQELVASMQMILHKDGELQEIIQLVGPDGLEDSQRITLEAGRAVRQDFLQQNAFSGIDASCSLNKQRLIMKAITLFYKQSLNAVEQRVPVDKILGIPQREELSRLKSIPENEIEQACAAFQSGLARELTALAA
ncbi:MAG: V-type ATP synthase subunit A [Chitinivibrionales bacterium]|nr:V-type ATP synthase subunit A [Chitinivibrionales bacterium]